MIPLEPLTEEEVCFYFEKYVLPRLDYNDSVVHRLNPNDTELFRFLLEKYRKVVEGVEISPGIRKRSHKLP